MPAHDEAEFIQLSLDSIVQQTLLPTKLVVVNDNSKDDTEIIIDKFANEHDIISKINVNSSDAHMPGSKVVNAFYKGFETLDSEYDIIVKLDADIVLPKNYFETICNHFINNPKMGLASGSIYVEKNGKWIYETIANRNHVRGAIKAYRKECFEEIGGLKKSLGWDSVDVMLAKFYGWAIYVDQTLEVHHLKTTGKTYHKKNYNKFGEVFYRLGYGFWISLISSTKIAIKKKSLAVFAGHMYGYFSAKNANVTKMVTPAQARFIRSYRRSIMLNKIKNFFSKKA